MHSFWNPMWKSHWTDLILCVTLESKSLVLPVQLSLASMPCSFLGLSLPQLCSHQLLLIDPVYPSQVDFVCSLLLIRHSVSLSLITYLLFFKLFTFSLSNSLYNINYNIIRNNIDNTIKYFPNNFYDSP